MRGILSDVLSDVRRSVIVRQGERRARAAAAGRRPRVLVIGTCQGVAAGEAMRLLLPQGEVTVLSAFTLTRRYPRLGQLVAEAKGYDYVFSNIYLPRFPDGDGIEALAAQTRFMVMPTVVFAAFHPDLIRVGMDGRPEYGGLLGPLGHAHSALAAFGYLEGLGLEATLRLFHGEVYRRLGYYDTWDAAARGLRALCAETGYDVDADLLRWSRRGCFMHSDNHPKVFVSGDVARAMLRRAGIAQEPCDLDSYLQDALIDGGTWPVYPEIAAHYGVPGNTLFLKSATPRTGPARTLTLRAFVEGSFRAYDRQGRARISNERVEGWRRDEAVRALLHDAARP